MLCQKALTNLLKDVTKHLWTPPLLHILLLTYIVKGCCCLCL